MSTAPDTAPAAAASEPKSEGEERRKLPLFALLALATAVFITSLTETLPAGLLPAMSRDLHVSESATGQTVTVYAIGTALTAIPLTAATAGWRRKKLLLAAMGGFALANTVTAVSSVYELTMAARFVAGVAMRRRLGPAHAATRGAWPLPTSRARRWPSPWRGSPSRSPSVCPPERSSATGSAGAWRSSR